MPVRAFVAVTGLIVAVFLSAGAMEGRTPESESEELRTTQSESQTGAAASAAPACPTPVPAAALPAQPDLARDIRTVLTGVKSPVQQDALAEAGKIAPGQMSDALRDVLVDVAAFVSSLDRSDTTGDPRLDSLAQYLVCALQPQVSQEELAADLDSPAAYDLVEPMRKARHISAAWLTMHIPAGDMGDELLRVLPRAMLSIGRGILSNYMAKGFLFEALTKQYAGYSDADLVAAIAQAAPTIEIAYIQQEVQDLRLQAEERAARIARAESAVRRSSRDDYFQRELADLSQEEVVARIRAIFEAGQYGVCGLGPPGWVFRYFPDTGAALLADIITRPTTPLGKMTDGLELLSELAASYKTGRNLGNWGGNLRFSEESRELLIATARHFMEGEFLSSLPTRGHNRRSFSHSACSHPLRSRAG